MKNIENKKLSSKKKGRDSSLRKARQGILPRLMGVTMIMMTMNSNLVMKKIKMLQKMEQRRKRSRLRRQVIPSTISTPSSMMFMTRKPDVSNSYYFWNIEYIKAGREAMLDFIEMIKPLNW